MFLLLLGSEANVFELHPIKIRQKKTDKGSKKITPRGHQKWFYQNWHESASLP
jgi:hypothetical protein